LILVKSLSENPLSVVSDNVQFRHTSIAAAGGDFSVKSINHVLLAAGVGFAHYKDQV